VKGGVKTKGGGEDQKGIGEKGGEMNFCSLFQKGGEFQNRIKGQGEDGYNGVDGMEGLFGAEKGKGKSQKKPEGGRHPSKILQNFYGTVKPPQGNIEGDFPASAVGIPADIDKSEKEHQKSKDESYGIEKIKMGSLHKKISFPFFIIIMKKVRFVKDMALCVTEGG
jgi:hypothetical protein